MCCMGADEGANLKYIIYAYHPFFIFDSIICLNDASRILNVVTISVLAIISMENL